MLRDRSGVMTMRGIERMGLLILCLLLPVQTGMAQRNRPLLLYEPGIQLSLSSPVKIQDLSFGAFSCGNAGGTVIIPAVGSRQATGDVILVPSIPGSPAIFRFTTDTTTSVSITVDHVVNLTNGSGGLMTLQIDDIYPTSPTTPVIGVNTVVVGGKLTVGSPTENPAGTYSGSFEITIHQE